MQQKAMLIEVLGVLSVPYIEEMQQRNYDKQGIWK